MEKTLNKELYSLKEIYVITYKAFLTVRKLTYGKKQGLMTTQFMERIMFAVTEVNACEVCSYGHTKMSLEAGMDNEEIEKLLSGNFSDVPTEELSAVMFAQHYADFRGSPTKESYQRLIEAYGTKKALSILGAVRIIMLGNVYGIAWSSFINRFKNNADERSNLLYELSVVIGSFVFIPTALLHSLVANLLNVDLIKFK